MLASPGLASRPQDMVEGLGTCRFLSVFLDLAPPCSLQLTSYMARNNAFNSLLLLIVGQALAINQNKVTILFSVSLVGLEDDICDTRV